MHVYFVKFSGSRLIKVHQKEISPPNSNAFESFCAYTDQLFELHKNYQVAFLNDAWLKY